MASLALGVVGAAAGAVAGGPMGFKLGLSIGTTVGGLIDSSMNHPTGSGKLTDLRVSSSSYGTMIPLIWGGVRVPGMIIWVAVDKYGNHLIEHEHGGLGAGSGGAGGSGGSTYTYTTTVAVALGRGTSLLVDGNLVHRNIVLDRVWANDLIIWEASQAIHVFDETYHIDLTFHDGSETQAVDNNINNERTNATPTDQAPAYRGTCYFVIKDLDLTPFGRTMPNFSAEVHTDDVSIADIVGDVLGECGVHATNYDGSAASGISVRGEPIATQMSGQDIITPLLDYYFVSMVEIDGQIRLIPRGQSPVLTIDTADLGATMEESEGDQIPILLKEHRLQKTDLPGRVNVTFYSADPSKHYEQSTQGDVRQTGNVKNQVSITLPITLTETEGRQFAARHLDTAWLEQDQYEFSLPPKYINLAPADTVLLPIGNTNRQLRILTMEFGTFSELRITATPDGGDIDTLSQTLPGGTTAPGSGSYSGPGNAQLVVPTDFVVWSGTELRDADQTKAGFYVAGTGVSGWNSASIYWSPDGGATYNLSTTGLTSAATFGLTTSVLADATDRTSIDTTSNVSVSLTDQGQLNSTADSLVATGSNNAVVGNEILGFSTANLTGDSTYTLSRMLRGRRNSSMTGHSSGEIFVLATSDIVRIEVPDSLIGQTVLVKCVSPGQTTADVDPQPVIIAPKTPTQDQTTIGQIQQQIGATVAPSWGIEYRTTSIPTSSDPIKNPDQVEAQYLTFINAPSGDLSLDDSSISSNILEGGIEARISTQLYVTSGRTIHVTVEAGDKCRVFLNGVAVFPDISRGVLQNLSLPLNTGTNDLQMYFSATGNVEPYLRIKGVGGFLNTLVDQVRGRVSSSGSVSSQRKVLALSAYNSDPILSNGTRIKLSVDFSSLGNFADAMYTTVLNVSDSDVYAYPNEADRTASKASWIVEIPTSVDMGSVLQFNVMIGGYGWNGPNLTGVGEWSVAYIYGCNCGDSGTTMLGVARMTIDIGAVTPVSAGFIGTGRMGINLPSMLLTPQVWTGVGRMTEVVGVQGFNSSNTMTSAGKMTISLPSVLYSNTTMTGISDMEVKLNSTLMTTVLMTGTSSMATNLSLVYMIGSSQWVQLIDWSHTFEG